MKGILFSIRRYSLHDGPGIRVTFFLKGCPLSCIWCHNPEGIAPEPVEVVEKRRIGEREFLRKKTIGRYYTADELVVIAGKDKIFMEQSGGGVTFSGGEPLMQPLFLREALCSFKEAGYHTAVDTSGCCRQNELESIIPYTDLFLFDLKHTGSEKHKQYTGSGNEEIFKNLEFLIKSGSEIQIRIPVIPGVNDDEVTLREMRDYVNMIKKSNVTLINLLPYHTTGSLKYIKLGMNGIMSGCKPPGREIMSGIKELFLDTGINVKTGG